MDIQLPGINGIEALERRCAPIRRRRPFRSIAVTASVMQQDRNLITERRLRRLPGQAAQPQGVPRAVKAMLERCDDERREANRGRPTRTRRAGQGAGRRRHAAQRQAARRPARGQGLRCGHRRQRRGGARQGRRRATGPRAARRDDAGAVRLRRVPAHPRRPGDRAAAGGAGHLARSAAGARQGHRGRRRRFPVEADQPGRSSSPACARCCGSRRCRTRSGGRRSR